MLVPDMPTFMKSIVPLFLAAFFSQACAAAEKPLNILVLYADDWRNTTLSCAGNPVVKTPELDKLAAQGHRFTRACVTTSICGVSRASLLTGQWMSRHGNPGFGMFKTPWEQTYPGLLRSHGYYVGHVGKWHNGKFPAEKFDFAATTPATHWIANPDGGKTHVTRQNENDALAFLHGRPAGKPFCLTLAFVATHAEDEDPLQYLPQPESMKLYQDVTIPVPKTGTDEAFRKLPDFIANEKNEGRHRWHWRFDTPDKFQAMMKNYYRMATEVDTACGRVLGQLAKDGLLENTLVIFTADNGNFHGEHQLADKWYPYEESLRVPLIIHDPRMPGQMSGKTNDDFALNVDLAPTILTAAGIQPPPTMQGRDLSPLYLSTTKPEWRSEFYYEHAIIRDKSFIPASQALVRKDMKYILWPDFDREQLFDLMADPFEENDLVSVSSKQEALNEMRTRFAALKAGAR